MKMPVVTCSINFLRSLFSEIIDPQTNTLLPCPPYNASRLSKIFHNELLKELYRDSRWWVPFSSTWNMPHIVPSASEIEVNYVKKLVMIVTRMKGVLQ